MSGLRGEINTVGGNNYRRQLLADHLKFILGTYPFDRTLGLPYYSLIFIKGQSLRFIETLIRSAILSHEFVSNATITRLQLENRNLLFDFDVVFTDQTPNVVNQEGQRMTPNRIFSQISPNGIVSFNV